LQVVQLLADIAHHSQRGVMMITHDTRLLDAVDTVYEMRDGHLKTLTDEGMRKNKGKCHLKGDVVNALTVTSYRLATKKHS
jgi:ABC-type lipoprotein export system ATPase subunit